MSDKLRVVPFKNYIFLCVVLVVSFLLIYYFYNWTVAYNESILTKSLLDQYMEVINYNELDDYLVENPDSIIYVSVLENIEIRDFEKKFKSSLKSNEINRSLLYMDITNEIKNDDTVANMNSKYSVGSLRMSNVPCIMVVDDGKVKEIYQISDNDYDVSKVVAFLNELKFSSEDDYNG